MYRLPAESEIQVKRMTIENNSFNDTHSISEEMLKIIGG